MARVASWVPAVLAGLVFIWGCSDLGQEPDQPPDSDADSVSFSQDVQPIFTANCALSGCHVSNHVTGLDLSQGKSYDLLVGVTSAGYPPAVRVKPFEPDESVLWHKVAGTGEFGDRMPLGGNPLDQADTTAIKTWIEEGALEN